MVEVDFVEDVILGVRTVSEFAYQWRDDLLAHSSLDQRER
jgi:hypothetical protein